MGAVSAVSSVSCLGKALIVVLCVLLSPAAAMLLAFSVLECLIGVAMLGGAVALAAMLGICAILGRRALEAPPVADDAI
jgi:hypothetical protein